MITFRLLNDIFLNPVILKKRVIRHCIVKTKLRPKSGTRTETVKEEIHQEGFNRVVGDSQKPTLSDKFKLVPVQKLCLPWQNVKQF